MKLTAAIRRKFRVRNKLKKISSSDRLRLSITRSTKNISAQIIDDKKQATILSASSNEKAVKELKLKNKSEMSEIVAKNIAKKPNIFDVLKIFSVFPDSPAIMAPTIITDEIAFVTDIKGVWSEGVTLHTT